MYLSITGDRQSGKTTLLLNHLASYLNTTTGTNVGLVAKDRKALNQLLKILTPLVTATQIQRVYLSDKSNKFSTHMDALYIDNIDLLQTVLPFNADWVVTTSNGI